MKTYIWLLVRGAGPGKVHVMRAKLRPSRIGLSPSHSAPNRPRGIGSPRLSGFARGVLVVVSSLVLAACSCTPSKKCTTNGDCPTGETCNSGVCATGINQFNHTFFPIAPGDKHEFGKTLLAEDGALSCESCHPSSVDSFTTPVCTECHGHTSDVTDRLHLQVVPTTGAPNGYAYDSLTCISAGCHRASDHKQFDHAGITDNCAMCHDVGKGFAALPFTLPDGTTFAHPSMNNSDCSSCHTGFKDWTNARSAVQYANDSANNVTIVAQIPQWSGFDVLRPLTPQTEVLPMVMNHAATEVASAAFSTCGNCHVGAGAGNYTNGKLHSSLSNLTLSQPTACASCHNSPNLSALPVGFVGTHVAACDPSLFSSGNCPTPSMKHDAVAWSATAPTTMSLVNPECGTCHQSPNSAGGAWTTAVGGGSAVAFHAALTAAGKPQPASCLDCHATSRPDKVIASGPTHPLPTGVVFDHAAAAAKGDCSSCHAGATLGSDWRPGLFHTPGSATPTSCLPCHSGEAPTSSSGWTNPNFARAPFNYGPVTFTNSSGLTTVPHGAGLDCATCHANPGTGQWGSGQNWAAGQFTHTVANLALVNGACVTCHSTQRPDLVLGVAQAQTALNFDHSINGTGDCAGCHQATVTANTFANYFNPATNQLPNGDWKGGVAYPGGTYAQSTTESITVNELTLVRSGTANLVTSMTSAPATIFNGFLHTSSQIPAGLKPDPMVLTGPSSTCWHCHTSTGTTVTAFAGGTFHNNITAPMMQPALCADCHAPGVPRNIVQLAGASLVSMDHAQPFATPVMVNGKSVASPQDADCSVCHTVWSSPTSSWNSGHFHANLATGLAGAKPKECVGCHYPLMAEATTSDKASANGTDFTMKHRSVSLTTQSCDTCHTAALAAAPTSTATTPVATAWKPGALHANLTPQPAACVDCHQVSMPTMPTEGTTTWTFSAGGTATNTGMWMNHAASPVSGRDCVLCHAADAKAVGAAWNKADLFHGPVPSVTACSVCHGFGNGSSTPGTNNNMPAANTNTTTITSASASTGVAGTADQISHTDLNVTSRDCALCHQSGMGGSWITGKFHASLSAANPLLNNGTTARCSNCHLNVKPGPGYALQDHSTLGNTGDDCSKCHSYPGTGTPAAPNWLGATGAPTLIAVGGFTIPNPPAPTGTSPMQGGIMSLPHPTVVMGQCVTCHTTSSGGKNALGYDHASASILTNCSSCHEAGSNLVGTPWNGATAQASGAGDTRPFTLTSIVASFNLGMTVTYANHFYPVDCGQCHVSPAGNGLTSTGAAYASAWTFPHNQSTMTNPSTCVMCHVNGVPGAPDGGVGDPTQAVTLTEQLPTFSGTTITRLTANVDTLPMTMLHSSTEFPAAAYSACTNCHPGASSDIYSGGLLHDSLQALTLPQPTARASCHGNAAPAGFVGPVATTPARSPASPEMRHDAVSFVNGVATTTRLVGSNCGQCHTSPTRYTQGWALLSDGGLPKYHSALTTQPTSCVSCHANTRPATVLTQATAPGLPANVEYDHTSPLALGDCVTCHAASAVSPWASWAGGKFHTVGSTTPSTCLPCHSPERPTSNTGWASTTYTKSPFDYGTNSLGIGHGDGLDCVTCHASSGTGTWGTNQNWQNGNFLHTAAGSVANNTCLSCHSSQRPDLVLGVTQAINALKSAALPNGFDHSTSGTGDCIGCHGATVIAGSYVNYYLAGTTSTFPGGDWKGGAAYPGSSLVSAPTQFVTFKETILSRTGSLVTGTSTAVGTINNAMLHVSAQVPTVLNAGPTGSPDNTKCWHCHTHAAGSTTVSNFANGQFHSSLTNYTATIGGAVTPLAQPTTGCTDCHAQVVAGVSSGLYPPNIVEFAPDGGFDGGSDLQPMDHAATFTGSVTLGGKSVTAVNQVDCSVCHNTTGNTGKTWADGLFHTRIGAAVPADCVSCHYPLMADAPKADLTSGRNYAMKHKSGVITSQACATCHTAALGQSTVVTPASTLWATGGFHANVSPQPAACVDCHAVSEPDAGLSTQSTVTYAFTGGGGTTSNGAQWANHGSSYVAGKDCATCHQADAKTSGSAWSKADTFHPVTTGVTLCAGCHGTTNGMGTVIGTNNNLPAGLSNSSMVSSAASANVGVPAGTFAQINHADLNVTAYECAMCHTQQGTSTTAGIAGKEWAQATFHSHFTGGTGLVMNATTGRCSNCHLNVKPATGFTTQDHTTLSGVSGTQDCASCHSFPGTGTAAAPNWLGASGVPATINPGGYPIPNPPATTATTEGTIANLAHPTYAAGLACTACHLTATPSVGTGKPTLGYTHTPYATIVKCNTCHEAGSKDVNTLWNGATTQAAGLGDTRPTTLTTLAMKYKGNTCNFTGSPTHFYPNDCNTCHQVPSADGGINLTTTGTTYTNAWTFTHNENTSTTKGTMTQAECNICHGPCPN